METTVFRRLGNEDAEAMAALESLCFTLPWSKAQCQAAFTNGAFAAFGIFCSGQLAAYVSLYHFRPEMEIANVATHPQARRKGLARRILHMVLQAARKMGIERVFLETRQSNGAAIALYESAGFVRICKRSHYYPDNGEDALVYQLTLPCGSARREGTEGHANI